MHANGSPRILITRLSHIGDCILTLPLATELKRQIPQCKIVWICEKPSNQLLQLCPDVDEVILAPKNWMKSISGWRNLRKTLTSYKFDYVIDPQGITKSAALGKLTGCPRRIGIKGKWGRELSPWLNNHLVETESDHLVDRTLELLRPFDIENWSSPKFNLPVDTRSKIAVDRFLTRNSIRRPFAIINPGASWPSKQWEVDRFAMVARYLHTVLKTQTVVTWAGDEELQMAKYIVNDSVGGATLTPRTNLLELAALCHFESGARFFIGCDTGPLHIASAMGTPCIGLYGPTRPQDSGAYGPQHIAIQARYQSGTSRYRRNADNDAMRDIDVTSVCQACDKLVDRLNNEEQKSAAA